MTKKGLLALLLAVFAAGSAFAQKQEKKDEGVLAKILSLPGFAPGLAGSKFFINGGVGYEGIMFANTGNFGVVHDIPPFSVSMDYVLPKMPFTVGGKVAFSTPALSLPDPSSSEHGRIYVPADGINVDIAARFAVHSKILQKVKNLDVSALLLLGFDFATAADLPDKTYTGFYLGIGLGGRYFFTKTIGVFAEADVKLIQKMAVGVSGGLSLKF